MTAGFSLFPAARCNGVNAVFVAGFDLCARFDTVGTMSSDGRDSPEIAAWTVSCPVGAGRGVSY